MGYLPLGQMENQCRDGLEQVARRVGLDFIINVVLDAENRFVDLVTGDFVQAHRAGAQSAKKAFGVPLPVRRISSSAAPIPMISTTGSAKRH